MTRPDVVLDGVPWSGATVLARALAAVDPGLDVACAPAAREATVGLLLLEPSSLAGADERDALDRLSARSSHVAVVITKIDAFWDWPVLARASRSVVDPGARWPVFAVSAAAAVGGAVQESGVDELAAWIRARLGEVARSPGDGSSPDPADVGPDPRNRPSLPELRARRQRLVRSRDRGRADRLAALRGGLAALRADASAELSGGIREIGAAAKGTIAGLRSGDVAAHERWMTDAVNGLRAPLQERVVREIDRLRAVVLLGIEPAPPAPVAPARPALTLRAPPVGQRSAEDLLLVVLGASAGVGVGRGVLWPLTEVVALRWLALPLAVLVGVVVAGWVIGIRRVVALRAGMRAWTADALAEARVAIEQELHGPIAAAEPVIAGRVMRHHERRSAAIAADVAAIDAEIRRGAGAGNR